MLKGMYEVCYDDWLMSGCSRNCLKIDKEHESSETKALFGTVGDKIA